MPLFRRESLHERLAREGGLVESSSVRPSWDQVGIHGLARPRRWDAVVTAEAGELPGETVHFVALADATLIVDEDVPDGALEPLATALEQTLQPPYRAEAVRSGENVWSVGAVEIEVVEVRDDVEGDAVTLTSRGGERTLVVDGEQRFGSIPALERLAEERFDDYVVHAERLDGPFWEVRVSPL